MSVVPESQNQSIERVLHKCSEYLYSGKKEHATFRVESEEFLRCSNDHLFENKERKHGNALIITSFCSKCGSCYGEVFPPRGKKN